MEDWTRAELLQLVSVVGTVIVALIGLATVRLVRTVHILMNSRLDELLKVTREASRAEGLKEGRAEKR